MLAGDVAGRTLDLDLAEKTFPGRGAGPDNRGFPGLLAAALAGKVAINETPGSEFILDKEFYIYVDALIRHYVHEEPVTPSLFTRSLLKFGANGRQERDPDFEREVLLHPRNYVIKRTMEHMGEGVFVGAKL